MKKARRSLPGLRADRRVTQARLVMTVAALLPEGRTMSQARYSQIENGEGPEPKDYEKAAIAAALDVRLADVEWPSQDGARVRAS